MAEIANQVDLIKIFNELSEIPFREADESKLLNAIVMLAKRALQSALCTITFLDHKKLYQVACAGFDDDFDKRWCDRQIPWEIPGVQEHIDLGPVVKGEIIEKYGLKQARQGVVSTEMARRYNLNSMMAYPIWSDKRLIGHLNHFSSAPGPFPATERQLLEVFARHVILSIDRLKQQSSEHTLSVINEVLRSLSSLDAGRFLESVAQGVCRLLDVPTCIVWEFDGEAGKFRVAATTGDVDEEYRAMTLDPADPRVQETVSQRQVLQLEDRHGPRVAVCR